MENDDLRLTGDNKFKSSVFVININIDIYQYEQTWVLTLLPSKSLQFDRLPKYWQKLQKLLTFLSVTKKIFLC